MTCNSKNIIYCLECPICKLQYVGQTKNKFLVRVNQHLNDIKHMRDTPVSRHFQIHLTKPELYILQLMYMDDSDQRDLHENYWISRLHTVTPNGLNILD